MFKKLLSVMLIAVMMVSIVGCSKNDTGVATDPTTVPVEDGDDAAVTDAPDETQGEPSGELIIGSTTELSGEFIPYFQNNAADHDVFKMTADAYNTVDYTSNGEYVVDNTVVKDYTTTENEDGSKTYTWTINDGLVFNDGTPITAKDYVATALLWSSNITIQMGVKDPTGLYFKGYSDFSTAKTKEFTGVNLISEDTFAVTLDAEILPYYFELYMVGLYPTKLSFWTDDTVTIADDGNGAYFSENFTKEAYEAKINVARTSIPRITCGPYYVTSYDESSKQAVLDVNPLYLGNYEGKKANIQTIIYKKVTNETALDELSTGAVDILNSMASGDEINAGLDLVDAGGFAYTAYDRNGYGKLQFICDFGPTQYIEVRKAIAHLLDRNDFAKAFTGGFGSVVNGPYGTAMWMYQDSKDELDEKLDTYAYSLDKAVTLLEEGGWVYDEQGNDYTTGVRYKKLEDGTLMPLIIEWASSESNVVSELLVVKLQENPDLAKAGIQINQTVMSFSEMLNYIYRDGSVDAKYGVPTYSMYNLASGFLPTYDRTVEYTTDPDQVAAGSNSNYLLDKDLEQSAKDMVLVDPSDKEGYRQNFVKFIEKWNDLLPDLPLYSNIYHDFYNEKLKNYNVSAVWEMEEALIYAHIEE